MLEHLSPGFLHLWLGTLCVYVSSINTTDNVNVLSNVSYQSLSNVTYEIRDTLIGIRDVCVKNMYHIKAVHLFYEAIMLYLFNKILM